MTARTKLKRKAIDDVLGGDEQWAHADQTLGTSAAKVSKYNEGPTNLQYVVASCDKCNFNSAYFYQLQIRSADEPMTTCT